MYTMKVLHTDSRDHGDYKIEDHGAGVHGLFFKTKRQRKFDYIGTFCSLESAKNGIEYHTQTGWSKPCNIGSKINPSAKWLQK